MEDFGMMTSRFRFVMNLAGLLIVYRHKILHSFDSEETKQTHLFGN